MPEGHAAGHNQGTRTGAKQQRPPVAANPGSANNNHQTKAREMVPRQTKPPTECGCRKGAWPVERARPHTGTPHPEPKGSGPGRHAPRMGGQGRESAQPLKTLTEGRGAANQAPLCRAHRAQRRLARACAVVLVTGLHAQNPPPPWPAGVGPRQPAPRTGGSGRESAPPRTPVTEARCARPPDALVPPEQRAKPVRKSVRCGADDGSPRSHTPRPGKRGSGPRPSAPRSGVRGGGE